MPKVSQAHVDARRQQILDAAQACFSRDGLHRATMQDIIRQSGLSAGAIYRYFASKEEIVAAIAEARHARERALIAASAAAGDGTAAIARLAQDFLGALREPEERERRRVGVQLWAEALRDERIRDLVRRGVDGPRALIADLIRQAQRRGELPPALPPDAFARVVIALFHGFVLQQAWDERAALEPYLATIDVLLAALGATAPGSSPADSRASRPAAPKTISGRRSRTGSPRDRS